MAIMKLKDALILRLTTNRRKVLEAEAERDKAIRELVEYKQRFRRIGANRVVTHSGMDKIAQITVEPQIWGQYIHVDDEILMDEEKMEYIKGKLANELAKGLIEKNIVQFIVKQRGENEMAPEDLGTIGAKLYVVPWEQMAMFKDYAMAWK